MATKVTIVRASNSFLYLPLYLAESYYFDDVQLSEHPTGAAGLPPRFAFSSVRSSVEGDRNAINEMLNLTAKGEIAFALADPMEIIECDAEPTELVVFGGIVKRPPFWVINGHEAKTIADLKIDNMIYYDRESLQTGHYLGRFIADTLKLKSNARFPIVKEVGLELGALLDKKQSGLPNCGALTVDVLGMARAIGESGFRQCKPILPIFRQKEFQHFVSCAFITRKRIVQQEPAAARLLLEALVQAVGLLQDKPAVVAAECRKISKSKHFRDQLRITTSGTAPKSLSADESLWVARRIRADEIYSMDLSIASNDWEGTARADRWTAGRPDEVAGLFKEVVTPGNQLFAACLESLRSKKSGEQSGARARRLDFREQLDEDTVFLKAFERLDLGEKTVIGDYRRFEPKTITLLQRWAEQIGRGLNTKTEARENFLIWAAPGTGKSFFIQQIASGSKTDISFIEINFALEDQAQVEEKKRNIQSSTKPTLVLYDEIDAKPNEKWPYDVSFGVLEQNRRPDRQAVFALIGSLPGGLEALVESIGVRFKGGDLLDRMPANNRFEIPPMTIGDRVIVIATQIGMAAKKRNLVVTEVDKVALYYVLRNESFKTPRQISELIGLAVSRMADGENQLRYEDLFVRNDPRKMDFWSLNSAPVGVLRDTHVRIAWPS